MTAPARTRQAKTLSHTTDSVEIAEASRVFADIDERGKIRLIVFTSGSVRLVKSNQSEDNAQHN